MPSAMRILPGVLLCAVLALPGAPAAADPVVGPKPQAAADRYVARPAGLEPEVWIDNLDVPWSLVFLGDGRALVSERPGRIRLIRDGVLQDEPWATFDAVSGARGLVDAAKKLFTGGEGGLMGLAVHPDFPDPPHIYAMYTYRGDDGTGNRVVRLVDEGDRGAFDAVIVDDLPGSLYHNGGRIAFGPDGMLYVAIGEASQPELAAERGSRGGKILRVAPDGAIPADNPFAGSPVFSYGHRNPQGLAWHPRTGDLFVSEHGPSGEFGLQAHDELNVVRAGADYGWPNVVGAPGKAPYVDPLLVWKDVTVPPAGMAFWQDDLYLATLGSGALVRIAIGRAGGGYRVAGIEHLFAHGPNESVFGRLRIARVGPDGALYFATSNRDGRGSPADTDDRIFRLAPAAE